MTRPDTFSYVVEEPVRADLLLSRKTSCSREFVQQQIKAGRVKRNGEVFDKPAQKLQPGDTITGHFVERPPQNLDPVSFPLEILYEDKNLLVINKPQDMVVHPAVGYSGPTLVHHLLHYFGNESEFRETSEARPGIVHRLDRGTSGVLLVAKNRTALEKLSAQFKNREVKKEYESIVWGKMGKQGKFESVIGRDSRDRKKMSTRTTAGREALTLWKATEHFAHFTHVALFPHTGRTHQLRVHLTEAGFPIVGDPLYRRRAVGKAEKELSAALKTLIEQLKHPFLHARKLSFTLPDKGTTVECVAKRPEIFDTFLRAAKEETP